MIHAPVDDLAGLVFPGDEVRLRGARLRWSSPSHYFLFHKPEGVLTARSDPYGRKALDGWLADLPANVFPVGRLDRATTGLLLLTDDGDLAHLLAHPEFHVSKVYEATLDASNEPSHVDVDAFMTGLELRDGPAQALRCEVASHPPTVLRIEVDEGRNHLVRNMVAVAGLELAQLHRVSFGPIELGDLAAGEFRELEGEVVSEIWNEVGGLELVRTRRLRALREKSERWTAEGRPHHRLNAYLEEF